MRENRLGWVLKAFTLLDGAFTQDSCLYMSSDYGHFGTRLTHRGLQKTHEAYSNAHHVYDPTSLNYRLIHRSKYNMYNSVTMVLLHDLSS